MHPDRLAQLDALWAAHLNCKPADLRSQNTIIVDAPEREGAMVCLINGTCVIAAAPPLAAVLRHSVGTRTPAQAFEPGRLKEAVTRFNLSLTGPNAVLVASLKSDVVNQVNWIETGRTEREMQAAAAAACGFPMISIPLRLRTDRLVADACGFKLYATVIHIGEITYP